MWWRLPCGPSAHSACSARSTRSARSARSTRSAPSACSAPSARSAPRYRELPRSADRQPVALGVDIDVHRVTVAHLARQDRARQTVVDFALHEPA
jgi:hypothetical protein